MSPLRGQIDQYIDCLSEIRLQGLLQMLKAFVAEENFVYETDLTEDELRLIDESDRKYKEHPEEFVNWKDVKDLI